MTYNITDSVYEDSLESCLLSLLVCRAQSKQ